MKMQYLVQMTLVAPGRPTIAEDGPTFIKEYILPTLGFARSCRAKNELSGEDQ